MIDFYHWRKKEKFLVLEVFKEKTTGFLLSLDSEKHLFVEKIWPDFDWFQISRRFRRHLEKWKVIVAADSSLALTQILPIKLERDADLVKSPLSGIELENLLAQTIAKVFTKCREEASLELNIDELDAILIDNRVVNFKVDGHHVLNPVDFKAKKIEAILEITLTNRIIFEHWKNFFNIGKTKNFFFTESAKAELFALKKAKSLPIHLLVLNSYFPSYIFKLEKVVIGEVIFRKKINWSPGIFLEKIESSLGVSPKVARKLYSLYLAGSVSSKMSRYFTSLFKIELNQFLKQLDRFKIKGGLYIDTFLPLPLSFPRRRNQVSFNPLPFKDLVNKLGFKIRSHLPWKDEEALKHLAPFFEFYYNKEDIEINHWLRRRLHWLGSQK